MKKIIVKSKSKELIKNTDKAHFSCKKTKGQKGDISVRAAIKISGTKKMV